MSWLAAIGGMLLAAFGLVVIFGAPYLPTRRRQREAALDLLSLKPGQVFYDLGCGDGSMLLAAARRGLQATGYELNPVLTLVAWLRTRRYGRQVKVRWGSFWRADIADADGIFVFLINHYMSRLDRMLESKKGTKPLKLVSYSFQIPGRKPVQKSGAMLLYKY